MRKSLSTALWKALLMAIVSCSADDVNLTCPDPLGSDARTIQTYSLSCFQPEFDGCFEFRLNESSAYLQSIYVPYPDPDPTEAPLMVDVGAVTCLSKVTQRPQSGWQYTVTITEKHGYVFKLKDGSLGRLFIDSWETAGGQVTKVKFTRQYPF
jgi:hypothetical protein